MNRLKIFLHGGMHKTGTTSLQNLLASEREELLKWGICYPGIRTQHHNLIFNIRKPGWTPKLLLDQLDFAVQRSASSIIFSAEVLSVLSDTEIKQLRYYLGDHEIIFIFVIRHWCDYLPSRWAQNCKVRDSQTFRAYIANLRDRYQEHLDIRFDITLNKFRLNTDAQIKAISYSNSRKLNRSVVTEIFTAMEFPTELRKKLSVKERAINLRLSWLEIEQYRLLNDALSEHLGLNKNTLFQVLGEYRAGDVSYNLRSKSIDQKFLDSLLEIIVENEKLFHISSSDRWIQNLNTHFQTTSANYFVNLHENKIFHGDYHSTTHFTDLQSSDIQKVNLKNAVQDFTLSDFSY